MAIRIDVGPQTDARNIYPVISQPEDCRRYVGVEFAGNEDNALVLVQLAQLPVNKLLNCTLSFLYVAFQMLRIGQVPTFL